MTEPIRVLQVFAEMNRGGAETMIMNLYRHIDRAKIQFDFIVHTNEKCAFDEEIEQLGGIIYRVPRYVGKNHFEYKDAWQNFFISHPEYKIIHGHVRSTASLYLKVAKKHGLITIAHSHNTSSGNGISSVVKNILQYPIRHTADYFLACSEAAGKWLFGDTVVSRSNFKVLVNAIETDRFSFNNHSRDAIRNEFGIENKYVIGHVGRFHPQKNHEFIIDVFKSVHNKVKNSVLLLIGDGALKESIQMKVRKEKLENSVIFAGVRSDVPDIFQGMDIFVMPSLFEGLPVTLIEAQASGLKIFASDVITNEVAITNNIEFMSLNSSAEVWADRIMEYRDGYERKNSSQEIIASGYDVKNNAQELEQFYLSILSE